VLRAPQKYKRLYYLQAIFVFIFIKMRNLWSIPYFREYFPLIFLFSVPEVLFFGAIVCTFATTTKSIK
jgi:hypothetical protein